jgi:hypothetical protein
MPLSTLISLVRHVLLLLAASAPCLACSSSDARNDDGTCTPDDADGIISEPAKLVVTVTDTGFSPKILTTQNTSDITLTLHNEGTRWHGFVVDCLPTPNADGCPLESCFPDDSRIAPLAPDESATIAFESPLVEGIYAFRSDAAEDSALEPGQFIIQ